MHRKVIFTLTLFLTHASFAQFDDHFYVPHINVLHNSKNIEQRLLAQSQLIFSNKQILIELNNTKKLIQAKKKNQPEYIVRNTIQETIYYLKENEYEKARKSLASIKHTTGSTDTLLSLMRVCLDTTLSANSQINKILQYKDYLFSKAKKNENLYQQYFLNKVSQQLLDINAFDSCSRYIEQALLLSYSINNNPNLYIESNFILANLLQRLDDIPLSNETLLPLQSIVNLYGTKHDQVNLANFLGYGFGLLGDKKQAKSYLLYVVKNGKQFKKLYAKGYTNLGLIYGQENRLDSALYCFTIARDEWIIRKDTPFFSHIYLCFAYLYELKGNEYEYANYINKSKAYAANKSVEFGAIYHSLGDHYKDDTSISIPYLNKAIALFSETGTSTDLKAALQSKYDVLISIGKNREAELCLEQINKINNTFKISKIKSDLTSSNIKAAVERIKQEKLLQETQLALEHQKSQNNNIIITSGISLAILGMVLLYLYYIAKKNKEFIASLKAYKRESELTADKTAMILNRNSEFIKHEVSKELHDNILSTISGLRLMSEVILVKNRDSKKVNIESLEKIHKALQVSYKDVESYIDHLRFNTKLSNSIEHIEELESYIRNVLEPLDIRSVVTFSSGDIAEKLSEEKAFEIIRISKELIHNIIKHAEASMVTFRVEISSEQLVLTCVDNGKGFDTSKQNTRGLRNIKDRVAKLQGQIDIVSNRGMGTLVTIQCPI